MAGVRIANMIGGMYKPSYGIPEDERFAEQFEWDDGDWLYRCGGIGPAYRLTDDQRDDLVTAFDRTRRRNIWIVIAVLIGWCVVMITFFPPGGRDPTSFAAMALGGPGIFVIGIVLRSALEFAAFRAPRRFFERRAPVAPALSKTERRQLAAERIEPSGVIGAAIFGGGVMLVVAVVSDWSFHPPALYFIAPAVLLLGWAMVDGMRKWVLPTRA